MRAALAGRQPWVTRLLIAVNTVVFVATIDLGGGGWSMRPTVVREWTTRAFPIANGGEWWRVITGGFLHFDLPHLAMNMVMLYLLGRRLEQQLGPLRFGALYLCALLGGSAGALIMSPDGATAGASGAIFGVMGAVYVVERLRGGDPWRDGLGSLIVLNLAITVLIPGISIGGHLGGLAVGVAAGVVVSHQLIVRRDGRGLIRWVGLTVLGGGSFVLALAAARAMGSWLP